jgi:hypothetical protein
MSKMPTPGPAPATQQEMDVAQAQETPKFLQMQVQYLMNRVGELRIALNRAEARLSEFEKSPPQQ